MTNRDNNPTTCHRCGQEGWLFADELGDGERVCTACLRATKDAKFDELLKTVTIAHPHETLRDWTPDTIAETLDRIGTDASRELWNVLMARPESKRGKGLTTCEWRNSLSREARRRINAAMTLDSLYYGLSD